MYLEKLIITDLMYERIKRDDDFWKNNMDIKILKQFI